MKRHKDAEELSESLRTNYAAREILFLGRYNGNKKQIKENL